jgi:hypothetical protein
MEGATVKILYVSAGPAGWLTRGIGFNVGSRPFPVMDEVNGERVYRAQAWSGGVLVVENIVSAMALLNTAPADVTFTVVTGDGDGAGTVVVKGFKAMDLLGEITDGTKGGQVVGYGVSWIGEPGVANAAATAIGYGT